MLQLALVGLFLAVITTGMLTSFALIQTYIVCGGGLWWLHVAVVVCGGGSNTVCRLALARWKGSFTL